MGTVVTKRRANKLKFHKNGPRTYLPTTYMFLRRTDYDLNMFQAFGYLVLTDTDPQPALKTHFVSSEEWDVTMWEFCINSGPECAVSKGGRELLAAPVSEKM